MKYVTINLGENKIEVHNSLLGMETIKVNDKIISNEFSIFGADHYFRIVENEKEVKCKIDVRWSFQGLVYNLYKDEKPIIVYHKNTLRTILTIVFLIVMLNMTFSFKRNYIDLLR